MEDSGGRLLLHLCLGQALAKGGPLRARSERLPSS